MKSAGQPQRLFEALQTVSLPEAEWMRIIRQGILLRLPYLESKVAQARDRVRFYEAKYNTTLDELKAKGLPEAADYEAHEDFIEWEYWAETLDETEKLVKSLQKLVERMESVIGIH